MRKYAKVGFMGSVGLLIALSAGPSIVRGQDPARPAGADAATGSSAGQSTELLIAHALQMAIEGSELQLTIRQAGGPVVAGTSDSGVSRTSGPGGSDPAMTGMGQGGLVQLQQQARRSFQASYELMKTGNQLLRSGTEARDERASASRLYAASNLYSSTLYSFARQTFGWQAGWEPTDRSHPDRGQAGDAAAGERPVTPGQGRERGVAHAGAGGIKLPTADLATVTLINHAVKESLDSFEINQSLLGTSAVDAGVQRLREHARTMATESRRSIEQILVSLRERGATGAPGVTSEGAGAVSRPVHPANEATGSGGQEGWSGTQVQVLAQQAREVIRVLDELGGQAGGATGATRGNR